MARGETSGRSSSQSWDAASLWAHPTSDDFPALTAARSVDVVVIGAGIAGLVTAALLERTGAEVLVLDRYEVGGIATRNTTAKVTALQGTTYSQIESRRDSESVAAYAAAQIDAVTGLRQLASELDIDCMATEAAAFTYATEPEAAEVAHAEYEAATRAGLPVQWVTDTALPFDVLGAVRLDGQFHIDPTELCRGLARTLVSGGVAEHTTVRDVKEERDHCVVTTEGGVQISAANVVIATQGPFDDPALLANRCIPMQSYALAAKLSGTVPTGMYLSCDQSVRSLRPAFDGSDVVAIVGGEGHPMGEGTAQPERWDALGAWTEEHFGEAEVTHRWATHDLVPTDHVPFIGRLAAHAKRKWVATGFAKWGMTNGYVAARIISESISGRSVPWAFAFDSTRIASTLNRTMLAIGKSSTEHLVFDRLTHRKAPRCTHQGCVLRRDEALNTWDCPCHGSRFTEDGAVIQGPAVKPLH